MFFSSGKGSADFADLITDYADFKYDFQDYYPQIILWVDFPHNHIKICEISDQKKDPGKSRVL